MEIVTGELDGRPEDDGKAVSSEGGFTKVGKLGINSIRLALGDHPPLLVARPRPSPTRAAPFRRSSPQIRLHR
jgi:hypothetical protein